MACSVALEGGLKSSPGHAARGGPKPPVRYTSAPMLGRALQRAGDRLLALAALAAALALVVPSHALAQRSDVVLAALVLFTALGIAPVQLASLTAHKLQLAVLVLAPFVALVPLAWVISRLFSGAVRDGVLALGVSSTEVAAVGLVALARGSAVLALGALAGSLVVAALLGPVALGALAGAGGDVAVGALVGRFALVVLVPLAVGLVARATLPQSGTRGGRALRAGNARRGRVGVRRDERRG
jgi:predicted Na+-dependent transporter